ncbi:MAG: SRPBCC family protein [Deltaproteobacteria bacterium]|nr:SRPBCC family protein [Deltaproteobacteria bacterium]
MAKKILIAVAVLLLVLLAVVATRPDHYTVKRNASIAAPPDKVYALLVDFHVWSQWSPWEKLDPAMKKTWSGTTSGVGAIYEWSGNDQVGKGRMTIVEATPAKQVKIKLEFLEPWQSTSDTRFDLVAQGNQTTVDWVMEGRADNLGLKAMGLLMDMDKMVGSDFEKGLVDLKALAEKQP